MQKLLSIVLVVLCGAAATALGKSNVAEAKWLFKKKKTCFYRETRAEVWENEKCCGNMGRR